MPQNVSSSQKTIFYATALKIAFFVLSSGLFKRTLLVQNNLLAKECLIRLDKSFCNIVRIKIVRA